MNHDILEERIAASSQRLLQKVQIPSGIRCKPAPADTMRYQKRKLIKLVLAAVCISLIGVISVSAFTGNFLFIPGLGSFFKDNNVITHSIENIVEIEKDGYTHKVLSAYIMKERIYLDIFYYKSDVGMTFSEQYANPITESNSTVDYWVYYNGEKCGDYTRSYGSSISLSYKMSSAKKGELMQVSLYSGEDFISDIELYPTDHSAFTRERPYAIIDDIILTADVQTKGNQLQVFISAILPKDADRGGDGELVFVNHCLLGFSEDDIYIKDVADNVYKDKSMKFFDENTGNYVLPIETDDRTTENLLMHRSYHFFYFDIPADVSDFNIIIPQITYKSKDNVFIEKYGPWEIEISR